jgi:hypothetical protein
VCRTSHYVILLIWSLSLYAVSRENREASHCASFTNPMTFQSSYHMLSAATNLLWNLAKQACVSGGHRAAKLPSLAYTEFKEKSHRRCMQVERVKGKVAPVHVMKAYRWSRL